MSDTIASMVNARLLIVSIVFLTITAGAIALPVAGQSSQPSVGNQPDIASHADETQQSNQMTVPSTPSPISCTLDVSFLQNYGITVTRASASGDRVSTQLNSGTLDFTVQQGSTSDTTTLTLTMDTQQVSFPDSPQQHAATCGSSTPSGPSTTNLITTQQSNQFNIKETGVQDTAQSGVQQDDNTITNDTTLNQSVDLDLIVPDDGDADGDQYNVTIDTSDALANGINVTGAALENDPTGPTKSIEIVNSITVTNDEKVTFSMREASADRSDGNISQEVITVALTLDATQHNAGSFNAGTTVRHVVTDEAGNTTANLSFDTQGSTTGSLPSGTRSMSTTQPAPGDTVTVTANASFAGSPDASNLTENIVPALSAENVVITDSGGATISAYQPSSGVLSASYSDLSSPTLVYDVTIPQNASDGTTYNFSRGVLTNEDTDESSGYSGDEVITVTNSSSGNKTVTAPGGVTVPAKYTKSSSSNSVGASGIQQVATDFRSGGAGAGTLQEVAIAFRNS